MTTTTTTNKKKVPPQPPQMNRVKVTSGKSNARKWIENRYPDTITTGENVDTGKDVVFEDALQQVQSFCGKDISYGHMVWDLLKLAQYYLMYTECRVYVLCFDKNDYVGKYKSEEQTKRDGGGTEEDTPLQPQPFHNDTKLPEDFRKLLSQRSGFRKDLLQWICSNILHNPEYSFEIPTGKKLAVSGHCTTTETYDYVALVDHQCNITYVWPNKQGEAELQFFFIFHSLVTSDATIKSAEIISFDTDLLSICLLFANRFPEYQITWKYSITSGWILYKNYPEFNDKVKRMSISRLVQAIQFDLSPTLKSPVEDVVLTIVGAGSDSTNGYYGITHSAFLSALFAKCQDIGDLYDRDKKRMNGKAYGRLVDEVYHPKLVKDFYTLPAIIFKSWHVSLYFRIWLRHLDAYPFLDDYSVFGYDDNFMRLQG